MAAIYDKKYPLYFQVKLWSEWFKQDRKFIRDDSKNIRPMEANTEKNIKKVRGVLDESKLSQMKQEYTKHRFGQFCIKIWELIKFHLFAEFRKS